MRYVGLVIDEWCYDVEDEFRLRVMGWEADRRVRCQIEEREQGLYEGTTPRWMYGHTGD